MKFVDRPSKTCYNQNKRKRFPKCSLALLLVFALLLGTSGSFSAQVNNPPTVIEFEPTENTNIVEMGESNRLENADIAKLFGIDWIENSSAVGFAAAIDIDDNASIADLREYNIVYGDLQLLYVSYFPLFGVGTGLEYDMMAGEARPVVFQPWWHSDPNAVPFFNAGFINDWDIPGFEGIQWNSSDESVFRVQPFNIDQTWIVSRREGTAFLQLTLPGDIIVQQKVTIAPRPPLYPRPEGFLVNPPVVRVTTGQTAFATLSCMPEEGVDGKLVLADWVSSEPDVAVLDAAITVPPTLEDVLNLRIVGRSPGCAVISLYVMAFDDTFTPVGLDIYSLEVVVTDGGGDGNDGDERELFSHWIWDYLFIWRWPIWQSCGKTLTISGETDVDGKELTHGNSAVTVKGTITSTNGNITNVTAEIINSSNTKLYPQSTNPRSTTFNLATWNSVILFSQLAVGSYRFVVTATNQDGTVTLINDSFKVVAATGSAVSTPFPSTSGTAVRNKTSGTNSNIFQWPLTRAFWVTDYYGCNRSCHPNVHKGTDVGVGQSGDGAIDNTPVLAMADGVIHEVGFQEARGNYVIVKHTINGTNYWTLYQHMKDRNVATDVMPGDVDKTIRKGQQIGRVGSTGRNIGGSHLHFEVGTGTPTNNRQNPMDYFNQV